MENKEFVFVLSHSYDAIERAAAALQLATNMAACLKPYGLEEAE